MGTLPGGSGGASAAAAADVTHLPVPHAHLWPDGASLDANGRLHLDGQDVAALAAEYGTPLYLYDSATIRAQCRRFRQALAQHWPDSQVAYASKAYLSPALAALLHREGVALDAVSIGEVGVALAAGVPAAQIHLHGNYKPDAELRAALAAGVGRIVIDSLDELTQIDAMARSRPQPAGHALAPVPIWLRICPDVATETHAAIQTGHAGSKFGLDLAGSDVDEAVRRLRAMPALALVGLHAHAGSQLFDVAPVARVVTLLGDLAADLRERYGVDIREISPGGGLAVAYLPEDVAPAIESYVAAVAGALAAVTARRRLPPLRLIVEPGRALVARAGVALYRVGPRKRTANGDTVLAVDGGMGDNPRPALYAARYHAALAERMTQPPDETVRVVGRYCESGDVLVTAVALPQARWGEVLAIPVSGAYHLAMASSYNQVPRPAVLLLDAGHAHLMRRRETLDDLLRLDLLDISTAVQDE